MTLMSFLTGVGSLFGSSGDSKTSGSGSQVVNSSQEQAVTGNQTTNGSVKTIQNSTGTSNTTGTQQSQTVGKENTNTTGQTTNYSSDVLASLDSLLTSQLGSGAPQKATDVLSGRLDQLKASAAAPAFDVDQYVSGIAAGAKAGIQNDLDSQINSILSATGSSEGGNSMSALLGAKLRNDASANLAGITSQARAQGEQIKIGQQESITGQIGSVTNDLSNQLAQLLASAKGGQQNTTGTANTTSNQNTTGTSTSQTKETTQTRGLEQEKSSVDQTGITQTTGKQTTNTKGSSTEGKGNLFDNILEKLGKSSAAA